MPYPRCCTQYLYLSACRLHAAAAWFSISARVPLLQAFTGSYRFVLGLPNNLKHSDLDTRASVRCRYTRLPSRFRGFLCQTEHFIATFCLTAYRSTDCT